MWYLIVKSIQAGRSRNEHPRPASMRGKFLVLVFCLAALGFGSPVWAGDPEGDGWEFKAAPYVWVVNLDGDMTVRGNTVSVDVNLFDIIKESDSIFALEGYFEARKGDWGASSTAHT